MDEKLIDYSASGFMMPIVRGDAKVYASVNSMMYPDDTGLDYTGSFFVYLLHPKKGSTHFTLEYETEIDRWITRDAASWVDNDIVQEIADYIESTKL